MIESKVIKTLVCDRCGSKDGVVSYKFTVRDYDGHRHDYFICSIELCEDCQNIVYKDLQELLAKNC